MHHKSRSSDVWFLRYKVQRTKFFINLGHFLLSDHPNDPKNQNFEKTKITPGDIIILHLCTTNDDMMYGSWYIKHDRYSFLSLWAILCSFTPLTTQKIRFWKKEKNSWRDYHFTHEFHKWKSYDAWFLRYGVWQTGFEYENMKIMPGDSIISLKCTKNHDHRLYCSWDMACDGCNCYFSFWAIFYPPSSWKSENFKKMKKRPGDIIILHNCTKNFDYRLYCSWDMARDTCNFYFSFWAFFPLLSP